jgi:hypothetical protein
VNFDKGGNTIAGREALFLQGKQNLETASPHYDKPDQKVKVPVENSNTVAGG